MSCFGNMGALEGENPRREAFEAVVRETMAEWAPVAREEFERVGPIAAWMTQPPHSLDEADRP